MAHILIIDDEETIRFLIRTVLESAGHTIFEAHDGRVALDILETYPHPFDLIILDLRMPRMDGIEFLSTLHDSISYPPIIVLTAGGQQLRKSLEHKVSRYLTKPFTKQELFNTVDSLMQAHTSNP
jgi:two-component system, OmpR family, response regulator